MTYKNWVFLLISLLILLTGCSFINNFKAKTSESKVTIKGYYEEPESLKDKQTIIINGVSEGEFVEIVVEGEIIDVEHVRVQWDEDKTSLIEKETLTRFDRLINQTLVIKTYMPEGIPTEKVKWKGSAGKTYEYVIQEDCMNGEGNKGGAVFYLE